MRKWDVQASLDVLLCTLARRAHIEHEWRLRRLELLGHGHGRDAVGALEQTGTRLGSLDAAFEVALHAIEADAAQAHLRLVLTAGLGHDQNGPRRIEERPRPGRVLATESVIEAP